jgi:hypothetical protein
MDGLPVRSSEADPRRDCGERRATAVGPSEACGRGTARAAALFSCVTGGDPSPACEERSGRASGTCLKRFERFSGNGGGNSNFIFTDHHPATIGQRRKPISKTVRSLRTSVRCFQFRPACASLRSVAPGPALATSAYVGTYTNNFCGEIQIIEQGDGLAIVEGLQVDFPIKAL